MTRNTNKQKHIPVKIFADTSVLTEQELSLLRILVKIAQLIDVIYLKQSGQYPLQEGENLDAEIPKTFYGSSVTQEVLEIYIKNNPSEKDRILSPFANIDIENDKVRVLAYTEVFSDEMNQIAALLTQAAELSEDNYFKKFLELRAEAFRNNAYRESDIAWISTGLTGPFEFTVGPYESYADNLFGVKRTFESVLGVVLKDKTQEATGFQEFVKDFDIVLGQRYGYTPNTILTPMVVVDEVCASGESLHSYIPMAYNLPNDSDIRLEVGSKKVFLHNVMQAKFNNIVVQIAQAVLTSEQISYFDSFETYLRFVVGHESAHGLSFHFDGEVFGPYGSSIEEAKADIFGLLFLYFLEERQYIQEGVATDATVQHLVDCLRQIRFGPEEAHAVGARIQLNWFIKNSALSFDKGLFVFNQENFHAVTSSLADELYALANSQDATKVQQFIQKWGYLSEDVANIISKLSDVPVDINPIFDF